jgi:hypothetical protein
MRPDEDEVLNEILTFFFSPFTPSFPHPYRLQITKDGVTVAKSITLKDKFENLGARCVSTLLSFIFIPSPLHITLSCGSCPLNSRSSKFRRSKNPPLTYPCSQSYPRRRFQG